MSFFPPRACGGVPHCPGLVIIITQRSGIGGRNYLLLIVPGRVQQAGEIQIPGSLELCFIIKKCHHLHFSAHFLKGYLSGRAFVIAVVIVVLGFCLLVCSQQALIIHIETYCRVMPSDFEAPCSISIVPSSCWRTVHSWHLQSPDSTDDSFSTKDKHSSSPPLDISVFKLSHFLSSYPI